jgi:2-desacetyl-2-hydroxyethyl bacteriochlorophyllide A dehydrogenase
VSPTPWSLKGSPEAKAAVRALAVEFEGPGSVRLVQAEVGAPGAGEVLVRTLYSGISAGTESLVYRGLLPAGLVLDETLPALAGGASYPVRYGYSCVGVVEAGTAHLHRTIFAFHPHQERFLCPADSVLVVDGLEPRIATLFPIVETALQISLDAGRVDHEHVVITGLGPVGILSALLLARSGAHVVGCDPKAWRRAALRSLGIDAVEPAELDAWVRQRTEGRGARLVIEASGNPEALAGALGLLAHEGVALVASWYGTLPASLPLGLEFHRRRLVIRSTQVSTIPAHLAGRWSIERRRRVALELMARLPLEALATHVFPVSEAADAFEAVARGEQGLIHAALEY